MVINLPLAYPPKKMNGMMIAGFPAADADSYTYPPELKKELIKLFQYRIHPKHHIELFKEKTIQEIYTLIQTRFNVLYYYLGKDEFHFAHVTIFYTDDIQHYLWDDDQAVIGAYKIIDENIGKILKIYPKTNILIMSDHGFQQTIDSFFINNYLYEKGWLTQKEIKTSKMSKISNTLLKNDFLIRMINYLFMSLPRKKQIELKKLFLPGEDEFSIEKTVDLNKSLVVGTKQGPLFLNERRLSDYSLNYDQFLMDLRKDLLEILTPDNQRFIKDIYDVKTGGDAPKFVLIPNEGYEIEIQMNKGRSFWKSQIDKQKGWVAHHRPQGIFLAYGKDLSQMCFPKPMRIYEIAEKIFQVYELPIVHSKKGRKVLPSKKNLQKVIAGLQPK